MFKKKVCAFMLVMAVAVTGCGNDSNADSNVTPTDAAPTDAAPTDAATPEVTPETTPEATPTPEPVSYEAGYVADFEDENYSFMAVKESMANSAEVDFSVVDFGGSKMLAAAAPDSSKVPYIAIDISSLAGDAIESVRSVEMDLGVGSSDGAFYSVSGHFNYYTGADNTENDDTTWSVYLENKNPKRTSVALKDGESFTAGAKNILMVVRDVDNAVAATGEASTIYIDNIVLYDADGNPIAIDTSVEFDAPDGFSDADWSNLVQVKDEVELVGMAGTTGGSWWPACGISTDALVEGNAYVDPATFGPGMIMTIYCSFDAASLDEWQRNIKLIGQWYEVEGSELPAPAWENGYASEDGKATYADGNLGINELTFNDSYTIAQISYDEIAAYFGEDWFTYVKFLGIADYGFPLTITSVTVGYEKKVLPTTVNNVDIEGFAVSGAAWSQAGVDTVANGGTFDVSLLQPGSVVTINYKSTGNVWLVANPMEGASFAWTRICEGTANANDDNTACQITYEEIVAALGTDDLSMLGALQCESDQEWEVYSVSIGEFAPEPIRYTDEVAIEGFAVSGAAWSQAGVDSAANGGTFDYTVLKPGTVVNISYKENGGKYWLVANPMDGASFGWTRICEGTALMNPDKKIAQITYDQIVEALGTDDFSLISQLQCESDAEWEVYSVTVGTIAAE